MRKAMHRQLLEFVESMREAHLEIKNAVANKDVDSACNMLVELQQMAVEVGTFIEKTEGEGFVTVGCVEDYCEVAFNMFNRVQERDVDALRVHKNLETALVKIENSIKRDIVVKKEIAFFPYNVNMWDSLESVYLRLKADPANDVYCVPIPYYELNPDGSVKEIKYDGLRYPKGIEAMDYLTYNFEERRPDEIYIHNPYDAANYVTRVPERFYSSNLLNYTDKLVYIPYFILNEIEPDNETAVESMRHFITLPAVFNAHRVIVQSEKMRQIYVNELVKFAIAHDAPDTPATRAYFEQKIDGSGSPKVEKLLATRRENLDIPREWEDVIKKEDGSWRKIVFYNTSLSAFLQDSEDYLEKLEENLVIFRDSHEKVALLWRPHPLMLSTMESMRPQLATRYRKIVAEYRAAGWGIYDESPDLDRAIVLSDAYYGDQSSVLALYKLLEKPIMIQNVKVRG